MTSECFEKYLPEYADVYKSRLRVSIAASEGQLHSNVAKDTALSNRVEAITPLCEHFPTFAINVIGNVATHTDQNDAEYGKCECVQF